MKRRSKPKEVRSTNSCVFTRGLTYMDGDSAGLLDLSGIQMTTEEAIKINAHIVGPGGYSAVWATCPYFDFMSISDKTGKKAVINNPAPFANTTVFGKKLDMATLALFASQTSSHYKGAVGQSYAIASATTFSALCQQPG